MDGKKSFPLLLIEMYFCNFGFFGLSKHYKDCFQPEGYRARCILLYRKDMCGILRKLHYFKKEMGPENVRSRNCLVDFVKRSEGCLRRGML